MPFVVYVYMKIGAKIEEKTTELQLNKDSTSTVIYESSEKMKNELISQKYEYNLPYKNCLDLIN